MSDLPSTGLQHCPKCGARPATHHAKFCPQCGGPLVVSEPVFLKPQASEWEEEMRQQWRNNWKGATAFILITCVVLYAAFGWAGALFAAIANLILYYPRKSKPSSPDWISDVPRPQSPKDKGTLPPEI